MRLTGLLPSSCLSSPFPFPGLMDRWVILILSWLLPGPPFSPSITLSCARVPGPGARRWGRRHHQLIVTQVTIGHTHLPLLFAWPLQAQWLHASLPCLGRSSLSWGSPCSQFLHPSTPGTALVYSHCPSVIMNGAPFHCHMCPALANKLGERG